MRQRPEQVQAQPIWAVPMSPRARLIRMLAAV
jgi:hypothetical protein